MKVEIEVPEGRIPYRMVTKTTPEGWEWTGEFRPPRFGEMYGNVWGEAQLGSYEMAESRAILRRPSPKLGEVWEVVWNDDNRVQYLVTALPGGVFAALRLDGSGSTATGPYRAIEYALSASATCKRVETPTKSIPPSDTWVPVGFEWRGEVRVPELGECYYSKLEGGVALWAQVSHVAAAPILYPAPKLGDIWLHDSGSRFLITCYADHYGALSMDGSGSTLNGWRDSLADVLPTTTPIYLDNRPTT